MENHKTLAMRGKIHPTCSMEWNQDYNSQDSNLGHSNEGQMCYHGATKPQTDNQNHRYQGGLLIRAVFVNFAL